jgi:hypothetical protein
LLLGVSHGLLALVLVLTACSGVTTHGHARLSKSGVPATSYDAAIYFCLPQLPRTGCSGSASDRQIAGVRARLVADPDVVDLVYVSLDASYRLGKRRFGSLGDLLQPGDLPAWFAMTLAPGVPISRLAARYGDVPGVAAVTACAGNVSCRVSELRAVGVVH